jgi:hypothetical protein
MLSYAHANVYEPASLRFGLSAGYLFVGIIAVIFLIALFTNPALPEPPFAALLG